MASTILIDGLNSPFFVTGGLQSTPVAPALSINPGRIAPGATTTITFVGTGTSWLSNDPTFSATGDPTGDGSWLLGTKTVIDDTHATLVVTTGTTTGTVTWTDSTTSQTTTMNVAIIRNNAEIVALMWRRRREQTTIKIR